jgi:hypothetical protein
LASPVAEAGPERSMMGRGVTVPDIRQTPSAAVRLSLHAMVPGVPWRGYRRDHLRLLAQRVEVEDKEVRILD